MLKMLKSFLLSPDPGFSFMSEQVKGSNDVGKSGMNFQ